LTGVSSIDDTLGKTF
jgi:hypothetical protein